MNYVMLRDNGLLIGIALFAGIFLYSDYTSQDIEKLRKDAKQEYKIFKSYALEVKRKYKEERSECKDDEGNWKKSTKCNLIKEKDPKLRELWNELVELDKKLKKRNAQVKDIREALEKLETLKALAAKLSESINA